MSAGLALAEASGVPTVLLHNEPGGYRVAVAVDTHGAVRALLEWMAALGHRRIAFVTW
jgi:DNA-binding LacI/PurR family transcriptional regulator